MAVLLGRTSAGATGDSNAASFTAVWKVTAIASGTLTVIKAQTKVANATLSAMKLGIYLDVDGTATNATLMTTQAVDVLADAQGTGVFQATLASPQTITNGAVYWLGWRAVGETLDWQGDASGAYIEKNADFTSPYGGGGAAGTRNNIIWGEDAGTTVSPGPPLRIPNPRVGPMALRRNLVQRFRTFFSGPSGVVQAISAAISSTASVTCTVNKTAVLTPSISSTASVTASIVRTRVITPTVNGVSTVTCSIVRTRVLTPTVNGVTSVTASIVRTRVLSPAVNGVSTVTGAVVKTAVFGPTVNGRTTVLATVSIVGAVTPTSVSNALLFLIEAGGR